MVSRSETKVEIRVKSSRSGAVQAVGLRTGQIVSVVEESSGRGLKIASYVRRKRAKPSRSEPIPTFGSQAAGPFTRVPDSETIVFFGCLRSFRAT